MQRRNLPKHLVPFFICFAVCLFSFNALAWQPYTHLNLANKARDEVIASGAVTINGRQYPVRPELVAALRAFPAVFDGGVVGPDGFPDITFGQAEIHPDRTGQWLRLLLTRAWQGQGSPDFQRNLAFTYGFLGHGAGDMWGHTFVNKYARGVFPVITQIFTDIYDPAKIGANTNFDGLTNAVRHLVTEYYVADATQGNDLNPEFGETPFAYPGQTCSDPDLCNYKHSTTGIQLEGATNPFIYDTLIGGDPFVRSFSPGVSVHPGDPLSPSDARGPVIKFFLDLRSKLIGLDATVDPVADFTNLIQDQINTFSAIASDANEVVSCVENIGSICDPIFGICIPDPLDVAECAGEAALLGPEIVADILSGAFDSVKDSAKLAVDVAFGPVIHAYLGGWVRDIDDGLRAWNEVGLQSSRGLFDPQTERALAQLECTPPNLPFGQTERSCKEAFGLLNRLEASLDDFKSDHLWFMLGLPHWFKTVSDILGKISDFINTVIDAILPINPIEQFIAAGEQYFKDLFHRLVVYLVKEATGVNIDAIEDIAKSPEAFLDVTLFPPGIIPSLFGFTAPNPGISLFNASDHPELDRLLVLPADHHVLSDPPLPNWPSVAERLKDDVEFSASVFAAAFDTVQQTRLLFLDGAQINRLLADTLRDLNVFRPAFGVATYKDAGGVFDSNGTDRDPGRVVPANVMVNQYSGNAPWLLLIDGDHAWRGNGLPVFPIGRTDPVGGNGQFPIWAACTLRPAFRAIFHDWEHAPGSCPKNGDNFCDDQDGALPDPVNDPVTAAPQVFTAGPANTFVRAGITFVKSPTVLKLDVPNGNGPFTTTAAGGKPPATVGRWKAVSAVNGAVLSDDQSNGENLPLAIGLTGLDGVWNLTLDVQDPCHTFDGADQLNPLTSQAQVTLDNTPPVITITTPRAAPSYTTADTETINVTADDGTGSGVKTVTLTLDGAAATNGQLLDFFFFSPGQHTLNVVAVDNLGNQSQASRTFRVQATAASLLSNWDRARSLGLIPEQNLYDTYRRTLVTAVQQEAAGQFTQEQSTMNQFLEAVLSARNETVQCTSSTCKRIDVPTASRFVTFADLLQANAGLATINSTNTSEGVLEQLDLLFLQRQIGTLGSYNALRHMLQQAIGHDRAGQRSTEKSDLQAFVQQVAAMKGQTGTSCTNVDNGCFGVSASAAAALTTAAQAVMATL